MSRALGSDGAREQELGPLPEEPVDVPERELPATEHLRDELARRELLIRHLSRSLWRAHGRLLEASADGRNVRAELEAMRSSTSWRVTSPLRALAIQKRAAKRLARRALKGIWWTVTLQLPSRLRDRRRGIELMRSIEEAERGQTYARWIHMYDTLTDADLDGMHALDRALRYRPLVSIVMPVFDTPANVLSEAIESVRTQVYDNWELCIADDASVEPHARAVLDDYSRRDARIRVVYRDTNGGISAASNSALALAQGELIGLLDHDDVLRPHALLLAVRAYDENPQLQYVYSDEDKIDEDGKRFGHYFKPDWNPALLLCQNYVCHFVVFRADHIRRVGGFRSEYDGSQDWDLALRMTETLPARAIAHIPHVLYHWRAIPGSAAADHDAKPYAFDAGRRAVEDHLRRMGRTGHLVPVKTSQTVRHTVAEPRPAVSVVVPTTGRQDLLGPCLTGLLHGTDYAELDVLVAVSDRDAVDATRDFVEHLTPDPRARVVALPSEPFNYAWTINQAARLTHGELLLMLNDDTEVGSDDWLESMVGQLLDPSVGAVGGLLLYPDGSIQSAGMLVGARGVAEHLYKGREPTVFGYINRARLSQDLTVVAGTCMLVRREVFEALGGLDEAFPVCYSDIDFCLRLRENGLRVLYTPDAALYHHETASFGSHQEGRIAAHQRDVELIQARWGEVLRDDPTHNPNLELNASYPSRLAFPPRVSYPWRLVASSATDLTASS